MESQRASTLVRNESMVSSQQQLQQTMAPVRTTPVEPRVSLKELLLSNYDKSLATKIGIKDFVPTQILSSRRNKAKNDENEQNNNVKVEHDDDESESDLEFIPFEKIDSRYPRERGVPVFDPNRDKTQHKLYRTNPSIPRPESKYGTRSSVYEQIIELKKQKLVDSKGFYF